MGRTAAPPTIEPATIAPDDVLAMTTEQAEAALVDFCVANGYMSTTWQDAFALFRRAAAQPGNAVVVPTAASTLHTERVHNCMQAITDSPIASGLAERAFDAQPGTRFEHSMREDACQLVNVCTNAAEQVEPVDKRPRWHPF